MGRKLILLIPILAAIMVFSCKSNPATRHDPSAPITEGTKTTVTHPAQIVEVFNPATVSKEYHSTTRAEVQQFIQRLNQIIRARNYSAWRETLSQEYIDTYSSPARLREISEQPAMKMANITLRNLNDYFTRVFVPSRNPDRIQIDNVDIEFISEYRVRAFTTRVNNVNQEVREILYDLEKINDTWKIIN